MRSFLVEHPEVASLLPRAEKRINRVFGKDAPVRLEVKLDSDGTPPSLFAFIKTSEDAQTTFKKIKQVEDDAWVDEITSKKAMLFIDPEFS